MDEIITVTVRLRRKKELPAGEILSRERYARDYAASQEDIEQVEAFAHSHLLTTVEADLGRRSVILKGKLSDFEKAFNTT
jgi:kumamolisin